MKMDDKDLAILDSVLGQHEYIFGKEPSSNDVQLYNLLVDKLPIFPSNVCKWAQRMSAYTDKQKLSLPYKQVDQIAGSLQVLLKKVSATHSSALKLNLCTESSAKRFTKFGSKDGDPSKGNKIQLKTAKGTRDYHAEEMTVRRKVFENIRRIFHLHGAVEIETPVFELKEVLTGKYGEDSKLIYDLEDQGGEILSLRYDLTVPFARYVAQNKISSICRYHIARVYRRDNPAMTRGRYREFYQCDFDIAGTYDMMLPDAECVQVIHQVLTSLRLGDFIIKVNHRKLLDGLFGACGVSPEKFRPICSAVDKLDKSPWSDVKHEMVVEKGLDESVADRIGEYVKLNGTSDLLNQLQKDELLKNCADAQQAVSELKLLLKYCELLQCGGNILVDMSLARGLDYYTGVIYEAILLDGQKSAAIEEDGEENGGIGSVAGGGRYDTLVGMFNAKNMSVPCVGVSFGIERLFAMQERKLRQNNSQLRGSETQVYVVGAGKGMLEERLSLCALLHSAGFSAQTSRKLNPKFLSQLQYAEESGIPVVVSVGSAEVDEGVVNVRLTQQRKDTKVPRSDVLAHLKQVLQSGQN